jgi:hypothetical protein
MRISWKTLFARRIGQSATANSYLGSKVGRSMVLPSEPKVCILAFVLVLVATATILGFSIAAMYREEMGHWKARQTSAADDHARLVTDWLSERTREVEQASVMVPVRSVLGQHIQPRWLPATLV